MPEILLGVLGFYLLWVLSEVFRYGMKSTSTETYCSLGVIVKLHPRTLKAHCDCVCSVFSSGTSFKGFRKG